MEIELNYYFLRLNFNQWKAKIKIELKESLVLDDMNKFCKESLYVEKSKIIQAIKAPQLYYQNSSLVNLIDL